MAPEAEIWLDGGHNPHAARAIAATLTQLPKRPTHLICGMMNTKDVAGFMSLLAEHAESLQGVTIAGQTATLSAAETVAAASSVGLKAAAAENIDQALKTILAQEPHARVLICGSLYLAGVVLQENG